MIAGTKFCVFGPTCRNIKHQYSQKNSHLKVRACCKTYKTPHPCFPPIIPVLLYFVGKCSPSNEEVPPIVSDGLQVPSIDWPRPDMALVDSLLLHAANLGDGLPNVTIHIGVDVDTLDWGVVKAAQVRRTQQGQSVCVCECVCVCVCV